MSADWRDRLARADEHLEGVEREVDRFLGLEPYRLVSNVERQGTSGQEVIEWTLVGHVDRTPGKRLAHVIGDFVENLRSSLDLIVYALAEQVGDPPRGTEFPVFWDPSNYHAASNGKPRAGSGLFKVRGLLPGVQEVIESLQPYQGVDPADFVAAGPKTVPESMLRRPLYLLHELRRVNFHRKPHVTGAVATISFSINAQRDIDLNFDHIGPQVRMGAFYDGAVLGSARFTVTGPNPVLEMNVHPTFGVSFDPEGPARGEPVVATLQSLRDHVEAVVFTELEPFVA